MFGDSFSTLIISVPQGVVLGMHTLKGKLVIVSEQLVSRPILVLTVAYAHRLTDGREAVHSDSHRQYLGG